MSVLPSWEAGYDQGVAEVISELSIDDRVRLCDKYPAWRTAWEAFNGHVVALPDPEGFVYHDEIVDKATGIEFKRVDHIDYGKGKR